MEDDGVGTEFLAKGDVFQQLGDGADAVGSGFVEDIEGSLGVDEQGGGGGSRRR
ncbi:hypothetical protein J2W59_005658 [Pseudomonas fluorescens]|jgi:hypothetical protein|nr:hypothetical protein [Pseudomonas fluorescens]